MADGATEVLLNSLSNIAIYHVGLINNTGVNIEKLRRDVLVFQAFLKDTVRIRKKDERVKLMRKEIHDAVNDSEDIIDSYIVKSEKADRKKCFISKLLPRTSLLYSIGKKLEEISGRVEQLRKDINLPTFEEGRHEIPPETRRPRNDKNVVGFEDVTKGLIQRLSRDTEVLDVIPVTGMVGLGKTTLAWMIYNHPTIISKFPTRIWLPVSQHLVEKDIFLRIIENFKTLGSDTIAKTTDELADTAATYLKDGSFLLVMDDVWSVEDWRKLCIVLPMEAKSSKVLITSRHKNVGRVASNLRTFVSLRPFDNKESWELLRLEALGKLEYPPELEIVGKKIAYDCHGLPLAIVIMGGILYESSYSNMDTRKKIWEKVSEDVTSNLNEDPENRMTKFILLSYENLPHHLRPCFLFLGLYPEDHEISASKLIRMWIAEGFIQQKDARIPLEEVGQNYLKDLINRNLVKPVKFKHDDNVKTCQIHDTLRDFCRTEAATENFLQDIKLDQNGRCVPIISESCRRLSIHSDCERYISTKLSTPRARSFVCFSKDPCELFAEGSRNLIKAFKFLRVLDAQPLKFEKINSGLYSLIHLRYIAMSITMPILPRRFNKVCNMQSFTINTTSPTLDVKANIWKMKHLRYFKTNASATLPEPKSKSSDSAIELQTLGLISVESCKGLHERAPNLKRLGIRGKLALLFEERETFDSLKNMIHLEKLKLVNDVKPEEVQLNCLPRSDRFPSGLTSLTLCSTSLVWDEISILQSLEKLEVLKLKYRAFIGNFWNLKDGDPGFPSLQFLHIEGTDLATWKAKSHHFPKLRGLVLKDCANLLEIPIGLAEIESFKMLELTTCPHAVDAARNIAEKIKTSAEGSEFKLSIFPTTTPPPE